MNFDDICPCSIEGLRIISELQNVDAVVDAETILDLIHRICRQGVTMVQCKSCIETPHPFIVTFPALSEQCLPLLEALCAAYDIPTQSGFFDSAMLVEQPPSQFICIRSKVLLGKTELDEEEMRLLVRTIIGKSLRRLKNSMESLKGSFLLGLDSSHSDYRNGALAFQAYKSSAESTMSQLMVLKETIDGESNVIPLA